MKKRLLYVALFSSLLASCQMQEAEVGVPAPEITARVEAEPETRTVLSVSEEGLGVISWMKADSINVFFGKTGTLYISQNTVDAASAVFRTTDNVGLNDLSSGNIWGLYPYNSSATCNGSSVSTTLPAVQAGVPETFDDDLFITLAHSSTTDLQFYNVCSGIKFSLSRDDIMSVSFRGNNNEDLAGDVSLTFENDRPKATVKKGVKEIILTPKNGQPFTKGVNYYIVTLPATLSQGFTVTFTTTDGSVGTLNYTDKPVTLKRTIFSKKAQLDVYASFSDDKRPDNVIYYTSSDGRVVTPAATDGFGANLVSNDYVGGRGVMAFDGDVTSIGNEAFSGCSSLTSIDIPDSVTSIGAYAFGSCSGLTSIEIPSSVTSIRTNPFLACNGLISIIVDPGNAKYDSRNGCNAIIETETNSLVSGCHNTIIPVSVSSIASYAFAGCTGLTSVKIPSSVTSIRGSAFDGCTGLEFISVLAKTPPTLGQEVFTNTNNCPIHVQPGSVEDYKAAAGWNAYAGRIKTPVEAVDLGLSVLWASCNVGAMFPEEYGDYFAWGEIEPKSEYTWTNYRFRVTGDGWDSVTFSKYNVTGDRGTVDYLLRLDLSDDAARVNWGGKWRLPSLDEFNELRDRCTWAWTVQNGVDGYKVTSNVNGNSIFLPAAGYRANDEVYDAGSYGSYWSSFLNKYSTDRAYFFYFRPESFNGTNYYRDHGQSVRPVYGEFVEVSSISLDRTSATIDIGELMILTATVNPENATINEVSWTSSNPDVASVVDGQVTGNAVGTATITAYASNGLSVTCTVSVKEELPVAEAIDLGLSVMWASCNVGASSPEEYGDYFAWGETSPKSEYSWTNYKFRVTGDSYDNVTFSKYNTKSDRGSVDNKTQLDLSDDAARANWGGKWRVPTVAEWTELRNNCTWTWTTQNGVNGRKVTSKVNGNSIFLPVAGDRDGTSLNSAGSIGRYWSSTLNSGLPYDAFSVGIDIDGVYRDSYSRNDGQSVRPVCGDFVEVSSISLDKTSTYLNVGESLTLAAMIYPDNATAKDIIWSSSDLDIASVSTKGVVSARAVGTVTITAYASNGLRASCMVAVQETGMENGHEWADLGLSVKWATCNVGASTQEDYGDYFAWGETETKSYFEWSNYKWCIGSSSNLLKKYNTRSGYGVDSVDNKTQLELSDDAARANWGGKWRMPTKAEQDELYSNCTWTWTTQNGVNGYRVISKKNGNSIFLPASVIMSGTSLNSAGSIGRYWSSTLNSGRPDLAYHVYFSSSGVYRDSSFRCYGQSVRPVSE